MHRFVDHTGEVELEIEAETEEDVFREALAAFASLAGTADAGPARREVEVAADDPALLLALWVEELVFLAEVENLLPERASALELSDGALRATVEGRLGRPRHLVKAVTLHDLELKRGEDCWRARLVLDV